MDREMTAKKERVDPAELAYVEHLTAQRTQLEAVWANYAAFLTGKYQLDPDDVIGLGGEIKRSAETDGR